MYGPGGQTVDLDGGDYRFPELPSNWTAPTSSQAVVSGDYAFFTPVSYTHLDGSIHPTDALKEAAKILIQHFMLFSDEKITVNMEDTGGAEEFDEDVLHMRQLLKTKLSDQDLSVRALNCLKAADVDTVGDLVKLNRNDLLKFRNFGKKSLTELDELLASLNLKFGMDVSIYKLDKD